jgi:hypothetical protein
MLQMVNAPTSSLISRFAWNEGTLYIEFRKNKKVYRYFEVPRTNYEEMTWADSVGSYFHEAIKNNFNCEPVPEQESRALGFEQTSLAY